MSNPLKAMIFVLVCVVGVMFLGDKNQSHKEQVNEGNSSAGIQIGQPSGTTDSKAVGDGLTDNEQLATLVGKIQGLEAAHTKHQTEFAAMQQMQGNQPTIDTEQITSDVVGKIKDLKLTKAVEQELAKVKNQLSDLTGGEKVAGLSYADFGIKDKTPIGVANSNSTSSEEPNLISPIGVEPANKQTVSTERLYQPQNLVGSWYVGADVEIDEKSGLVTPALSKAQIQKMNFGIETASSSPFSGAGEEEQIIPYATIPQESTLTDAVTMSALLGRIPVGGAVTDPYEFKVLVGGTNLAANGLYIPNIDRIVMRGVAKGDFTGQCVSGDIVSATFVFQDGRIQTINASDVDGGKDDYESAGTVTKTRLGWISTRGGVPCLSGEYISDAPKFIALQGGLGALGAAGEAYAEASQVNLGVGDDSQAYVRDSAQYASGNALSSMVGSTTDWISEIKESAFGLVYLTTNQNVDIHITKELRIDYDRKGRKIFYGHNNGKHHVKKRLD